MDLGRGGRDLSELDGLFGNYFRADIVGGWGLEDQRWLLEKINIG